MGIEKFEEFDELKNLHYQIKSALSGNIVKIDNPLGGRIKEVFNLLPSRFTVIAGATGSGKTSYCDFSTVLGPFEYLKANDLLSKVHWEVNYFSLERKRMFKHAKWISWKIYMDYGDKIPADRILGWDNLPVTDEIHAKVRSYDDYMQELLDYVKIYDGKVKIEVLARSIKDRARALGVFYYTNEEGLFVDDNPVPLRTFEEHGRVIQKKRGSEVVIDYEHNGEKFFLAQDDKKYFLHNKKTFVFYVIDGIGLMAGTEFKEKKSRIDAISSILSEARDNYGFSPVVVSQFNRSISDIQRKKLHGSDLSPQLEDIQDSSQIAHDADLVLAIHDPFRHKSYDSKGNYGDYNITNGMMSPKGFCRFRSLHVLKNSFGYDGKIFGLLYVGEVNHFKLMPSLSTPNGQIETSEIYSKISDNTI